MGYDFHRIMLEALGAPLQRTPALIVLKGGAIPDYFAAEKSRRGRHFQTTSAGEFEGRHVLVGRLEARSRSSSAVTEISALRISPVSVEIGAGWPEGNWPAGTASDLGEADAGAATEGVVAEWAMEIRRSRNS